MNGRLLSGRGGQATVMVTLALVAMSGVLGLAIDLGWSYFVKKSAQAAADAAALAAVSKAQSLVGSPPFTCGTGVQCTGTVSCPTSGSLTGNLNSACIYAALNGFTQGGKVNVTVTANTTSPAPTVPGVKVDYWVTVRVNQQVPQLFSAVLGNMSGLVSARATAALTNVIFNASLVLLNRQNDPNPAMATGQDLAIQGSGVVQAPGGAIIASTSNASGGGTAAANLGGQGSVTNTPFSLFRGAAGSCVGNGGSNCDTGSGNTSHDWTQPPTYNVPDGRTFQDPTTLSNAKTQPPLNTSSTNICPVAGGNLAPANVPAVCRSNGGNSLGPGVYYASVSSTNTAATGAQLSFAGSTTTFNNSGTAFGQYVFYGGLTTSGGNQTITFAPGMYVFAGTTNNNPEFFVDNGTTLNDGNTGGSQSNAGELFVFTNYNYAWAANSTPDGVTSWSSGTLNSTSTLVPPAVATYGASNFQFGQGGFSFRGGNNNNTSMTLSGLNPDGTNVPGTLTNYDNFFFWQDRANSYVEYDGQGNIVTSGLGCTNENPGLAQSVDNPCENTLSNANSPQLNLLATPHTNLSGYIYQPRGAWLNMQGGGAVNGPLRIITGALNLGGGPTVTLTGVSAPITITETALIE